MTSKLPVRESVGMALSTLRANKLRSLLTMLALIMPGLVRRTLPIVTDK